MEVADEITAQLDLLFFCIGAMTRYTSLAYKRSHHDAGFVQDDEPAELAPDPELTAPPKKKRKVDSATTEDAAPVQSGWGRGTLLFLVARKD